MQVKKILLTTLFALSTVSSCNAGIVNSTSLTVVIPALYVGAKLYQADGNLDKTQRLIRQDKNALCTHAIDFIEKECTHDLCKEMIKLLKQAKSTPSQIIEDIALEEADKVIKTVQETDLYKTTEKITIKSYNDAKKVFHEWAKSKK